jgi:hypothetical protein
VDDHSHREPDALRVDLGSVDLASGDLDDTIVTSGATRRGSGAALDDTIVRGRVRSSAPAHLGRPALIEPREPAHEAQQLNAQHRNAQRLNVHRSLSFRVNNESPIQLDVPAIIGRKPIPPRVPGVIAPRLVRVSSPLQEVSGTHVEVSQHGTSVVITDLMSTNGTIVRTPGVPPHKLRQGESVVVLPGTLVDIGDGNVLEILPMRRLIAPDGAPGERFSQ